MNAMRTCHSCRRQLGPAFAESPYCPCCGGAVEADLARRVGPPPRPEYPPLEEVLPLVIARAAEGAAPADRTATAAERSLGETAYFDTAGNLVSAVGEKLLPTSDPAAAPQPTPAPPAKENRLTQADDVGPAQTLDEYPAAGPSSGTITGSTDRHATIRTAGAVDEAPALVVNRRVLTQSGTVDAPDADYQLIDLIGEGGIGAVYAARQASIDRTVALKMLKSDKVDEQQRGKFLSEAVITGELDHPNIVPIYDLGTNQNGALFYSMKRVRGTPWNKVIARKPLVENLEILMKVADAVAFAHSRHVVHRDLKPENVMLGDFGEVLVMDWGLALAGVGGGKAPTGTHDPGMGGAPAYMAPEMAVGPVDQIDFRSDVYLLGAILYEIVTGKPPHTGPNVLGCLFAATRNEIVPTEQSSELIDIARRAMATRREERHQSAQEFQAEVRAYQSHAESVLIGNRAGEHLAQAIVSQQYADFSRALFGYQQAAELWSGNDEAFRGIERVKGAYAEAALSKGDFDLALSMLDPSREAHADLHRRATVARAEREQRQQRLQAAKRLAVGLAALVIAVGTAAFLQIRRDRDRAVAAEETAVVERKAALNAEREAQQAADVARSEAERARRAELLAKQESERAKKAEQGALESQAVAVAAARAAQDAREAESYEAYVARIGLAAAKIEENSFGSAQQLLDVCEPKRRRWEWGRLTYLCGRSLRDFAAGGPVDGVAYSPDGSRLAAAAWDGRVHLWSLTDPAAEPVVLPYGASYVHGLAFSPDGRELAVCGNDPAAYVQTFELAGGRVRQTFRGHEDGVLGVVYSRDGSRLLTCSYDRTARLWDVATGRELKRFEGHNWWVWAAGFAPPENGRPETRVVTAGQDGVAIVWDIETATAGPPFRGHDGPVYAAAFSPDGKQVVTAGADKRLLLWKPEEVEPFDFESLAADRPPTPPKFQTLEGHGAAVRSVAFSPDGARLVSGGHDNTVRVWDIASLALVKTLRGHAGWVRACAFLADGRRVVSGSHDQRVMLWDVDKYEEQRVLGRRTLQGHSDAVLAAAFSPDDARLVTAGRDHTARLWDVVSGTAVGQLVEGHAFLASQGAFVPTGSNGAPAASARLVTAGGDNTARVWDAARGVEIARLEPAGRAAALAVSSDGRRILTGDDDGGAVLWNAADGKSLVKLPSQGDEVVWTAFAPDGAVLLTGEADGTCRLWNAADGRLLRTLDAHRDRITGAVFTDAGRRLLTASADNTVVQWDTAAGREAPDRTLSHPAPVTSLAVDAAGRVALTGCGDGNVRIWDLAEARLIGVLHQAESAVVVDLSADGRWALAAEPVRGIVRTWDLGTKREPAPPGDAAEAERPPLLDLAARGELVWSARFSPDGTRILTVGGNGAMLWDARTGAEVQGFYPHGAVAAVDFAADGRLIATGSWDHSVKIWDAQTRQAVRKIDGLHRGNVNAVCFASDGRRLATASEDGTARIVDATTGAPQDVVLSHGAPVLAVRFDAKGARLVTGCADGKARIWNAADGKQLAELSGHAWGVQSAAFSFDGTRVATGSGDNTAAVWDAASGRRLLVLDGHTAGVSAVAFTHDDDRLLTGAQDDLAKLWDARTGKEILTLRGHTEEITAVAFSHDDRYALTAGRDGTALLWPAADWRSSADAERLAPDARTPDNRPTLRFGPK